MNTPEMKSAKIAICRAYSALVDAYPNASAINETFGTFSDRINSKFGSLRELGLISADDLLELLNFSEAFGVRCLDKARTVSRISALTNLSF